MFGVGVRILFNHETLLIIIFIKKCDVETNNDGQSEDLILLVLKIITQNCLWFVKSNINFSLKVFLQDNGHAHHIILLNYSNIVLSLI